MFQKEEYLIINDYTKPGDAIYQYAYSREEKLYFHAPDELRQYSSCIAEWNDTFVKQVPELEISTPHSKNIYGVKYSIFSSVDNFVCDKLFSASPFHAIISPVELTKEKLERILSEIYSEDIDILSNLRRFDSCKIAGTDWLYFVNFENELCLSFFFTKKISEIVNFKSIATQYTNVKVVSLSDYNDWFHGRSSKKIREALSPWPKMK